MLDKRHLRFASIDGIERKDIPIAIEIWLHDICISVWSNSDHVKLATVMSQYIKRPDGSLLDFNAIEHNLGLEKLQVMFGCRVMRSYGVMEKFDCNGTGLKATLNLSYLQRLRVLEVRNRFAELKMAANGHAMPWHGDEFAWLKICTVGPDGHPSEELLAPALVEK